MQTSIPDALSMLIAATPRLARTLSASSVQATARIETIPTWQGDEMTWRTCVTVTLFDKTEERMQS